MANIEVTVRSAIEIISNTETGREIADRFDGDEIPLGQNLGKHVLKTIKALENFECFNEPKEFFEVFSRAIDLVEKHDATPDTLHLYLNNLDLTSGQPLIDSQLEILYLQVMRWFYHYGKTSVKQHVIPYEPEWKRELDSCTPCACDYTASNCECEKVFKMYEGKYDDAYEETCACHMYPHRNLQRLIYPITESGNFAYLKRRLELIPDNHERLKLLLEEKAEFEQSFGGQVDPPSYKNYWDIGFSEKCRIEIEKLENLEKLESLKPSKRFTSEGLTFTNKNADGYKLNTGIRPIAQYVDDDAGSNEEEPDGAKLLASVCPLFANAMLETRRIAWGLMLKFTRKQWAYFVDATKILKTSTDSERAKYIENISGLTGLRTLFGKQPTATDRKAVSKVITLLNADRIKTQNA